MSVVCIVGTPWSLGILEQLSFTELNWLLVRTKPKFVAQKISALYRLKTINLTILGHLYTVEPDRAQNLEGLCVLIQLDYKHDNNLLVSLTFSRLFARKKKQVFKI